MGIEPIKGVAMSYQGSSISQEIKTETVAKVERTEAPVISDSLAKDTMAMNTKETDADGGGNQGKRAAPPDQPGRHESQQRGNGKRPRCDEIQRYL